ncbi:uncharacterized protein LOC111632141 isoform X1 [Centruroides sculpturatus]|uniref:uncharacterized protein LOC111632141 isoform X1 n=1 Tax=Centruroides sculpturatus TaxID=218467 RepID=UPI000C6E5053|nr:uncharacterized protein LOC111632141 isoform X1 [Centruroides sculpturatus]
MEEQPNDFVQAPGDFSNGVDRCSVCMKVIKSNKKTCRICEIFFLHSLKHFDDPICESEGDCDSICILSCSYCRLMNCYKIGMTAMDAYEDLEDYYKDIQLRLSEEFKNKKSDDDRKWLKANHEFLRFESTFNEWISQMYEFQTLSEDVQETLKEKYKLRGTIMEIVDRSLHVHMVLNFHTFFWDPTKYERNDITQLMRGILTLTLKLQQKYSSVENLNRMKLKLILKDDINVDLSDAEDDELSSLSIMLDSLEVKMSEVKKLFNVECIKCLESGS